MDCIWVNLKNVGPPFFQIYISLHRITSKCHLHSWKIVLSCYVALILKDFCFANLRFRAQLTKLSKIT